MTIRIDNYVAPTSWDDLEMDWADPDPTDCKYVHAIILAIRERLVGPSLTGYATPIPVIISPDIRMKHSTLIAIHNWTFNLWKGNLDNQIRYLNCDEPVANRTITKTANDPYYTGTYDYHLCDLNYWTDESIIDAIGDDAIVWPQPDVRDNKAWLIQQYKILNKLNTHTFSLQKVHSAYYKGRRYYKNNGTVYEDSVSDWLPVLWYSEDRSAYKTFRVSNENTYVIESMALKFVWSNYIAYQYAIDLVGFLEEYYVPSGIEWRAAPGVFGDVDSVKFWFTPYSYNIPANTIPLIDYQDGDVELLGAPPLTNRYGRSETGWEWGIRRVSRDLYYGFPKPIGKFNFNFQD